VIARDRLGLYVDAVRHMRPDQLWGRLRRIVPVALLVHPTRAPPPWSPRARGVGVREAPQSGPTSPPHEEQTFTAVGAQRTFNVPRFWTDGANGMLFLFHLHGFGALAGYANGVRTASGDAFCADVVA
jgi:hypothetical protein